MIIKVFENVNLSSSGSITSQVYDFANLIRGKRFLVEVITPSDCQLVVKAGNQINALNSILTTTLTKNHNIVPVDNDYRFYQFQINGSVSLSYLYLNVIDDYSSLSSSDGNGSNSTQLVKYLIYDPDYNKGFLVETNDPNYIESNYQFFMRADEGDRMKVYDFSNVVYDDYIRENFFISNYLFIFATGFFTLETSAYFRASYLLYPDWLLLENGYIYGFSSDYIVLLLTTSSERSYLNITIQPYSVSFVRFFYQPKFYPVRRIIV